MLKGSIVALVTPFDKQNRVDEERLRYLVDWHIEHNTDAILVCGTTGECATLTPREHRVVVDIAVGQAAKRAPVIAGCGANCTQEALDLTAEAKDAGADYALIITPYYNKPTSEGLYRHFKKISDTVDIPVIIYNVPSRTGCNISPEVVSRLYKDCRNIVGIKEASGSLDQITRLMGLVDDNFLLFSGSDEITLPILSVGGVGVISVVANIAPQETHNLVDSFLRGDIKEARRLQVYFYNLIKALFWETNPIPVKAAMGLMKLCNPSVRLPLWEMSQDNLRRLSNLLGDYGMI
ncbi:MAG: 4-hydroxy-tetrahydrodipicolinate synthase [Candidatus Omnitrophota bacterium]